MAHFTQHSSLVLIVCAATLSFSEVWTIALGECPEGKQKVFTIDRASELFQRYSRTIKSQRWAFSPAEHAQCLHIYTTVLARCGTRGGSLVGFLSVCHRRATRVPLPCQWLRSGANPPSSARDSNKLGVLGGAGRGGYCGGVGGEAEGWLSRKESERKRNLPLSLFCSALDSCSRLILTLSSLLTRGPRFARTRLRSPSHTRSFRTSVWLRWTITKGTLRCT